jgi:hypothetical protein
LVALWVCVGGYFIFRNGQGRKGQKLTDEDKINGLKGDEVKSSQNRLRYSRK